MLRDRRRTARVCVGMNTYNGGDRPRMEAILRSYERTVGQRDDVALVLLDDGSSRTKARAALARHAEHLNASLLQERENVGITQAWNDLSRFDPHAQIIVLLNDDLVLAPRWLDSIVYFLDHNECGAASLGLFFCVESDLGPLVRGEEVIPRDPHTKEPRPELGALDPNEAPGAVMCPLGCCFGFRRTMFDLVGGFDERTVMTHNESWIGTAWAEKGLPSYVLPSPRVWHLWSATFRENPGLAAKWSGDQRAYDEFWGGHFNVTHPRYMSRIGRRTVRWLDGSGIEREQEIEVR